MVRHSREGRSDRDRLERMEALAGGRFSVSPTLCQVRHNVLNATPSVLMSHDLARYWKQYALKAMRGIHISQQCLSWWYRRA